jgi:hypothetical protein
VGVAVGPQDLTAIAEETELHPPRPSPAAQTPARSAALPTELAGSAAAVPGREARVETATSKASRPGPGLWAVALGLLALAVLGGGAGVLWAALGAREREPVEVKTVVVAPPPGHVAAPLEKEPAPAPDPPPSEEPAAAPRPAKSRWAKAEKFERPAQHEPVPAPQQQPAAPPPSTGAVKVTSDPPMEIVVDGSSAGVTPTILELPAGPHQLELREPRLGLAWRRTVEVSAGAKESVQWKPGHGLIDVRPVPPHVELQISVDGVPVGPTPISAFSVWEGSRRVSARNEATGWKTEQSVEVPPGGRLRIKVNDGAGMEVVAK